MLQGRPKGRLAGHSAGKGCLSGICRGRKTQNQYSSRLCRESTCFHGIAVPPYWFHSYIFEIVTIVVYWFCGRGNAPSRQSNLGGAVLCHNALGGPSHDRQLARKEQQILCCAHAYDRWQKNQTWVSTGLSVTGNEGKARQLMLDMLGEKPEQAAPPDMLFSDAVRRWLEDVRHRVDEVTYQGYEVQARAHILPYFDDLQIRLCDVDGETLQTYINVKAKFGRSDGHGGLSAVSLRQHKNVLNQTLKLAQRDGLIQTNPADLVVMPHAAQFTGTFYTEAQMRDLLTAVKNERLYPIIYVTALYGLRRSEVLGLKWDSINFAMQTLTIRHTVARVTKVVEKNKTKNASSFRSFPLTDDAVRLFKILLQQEQYYRNHFGKDYIDNDYVFTWEDGHPYSPDYVSHTFHKLLKKYDLPHIRFHDLRHTCASMLLSEGYGLKDVQEWLGHSDIKMTANIYGHLDIRRKRSIANGLEQALPRLKP